MWCEKVAGAPLICLVLLCKRKCGVVLIEIKDCHPSLPVLRALGMFFNVRPGSENGKCTMQQAILFRINPMCPHHHLPTDRPLMLMAEIMSVTSFWLWLLWIEHWWNYKNITTALPFRRRTSLTKLRTQTSPSLSPYTVPSSAFRLSQLCVRWFFAFLSFIQKW